MSPRILAKEELAELNSAPEAVFVESVALVCADEIGISGAGGVRVEPGDFVLGVKSGEVE